MTRLRLGVALLLPSPVAEEVDGLRRALGDRSLGRVPPHLTLVPPVNVRAGDLSEALAVLRAAAAATAPRLTVTLGPPTTFLPANPVVYLPLAGDQDGVAGLRQRVWAPPLTRTLTWPFVAHVTLADDAAPERIHAALVALAGYSADVTFDRVHLLVERRPGPDAGLQGRPGPQWRPLADVAFGPPAVVARGGPLAVTLVRSGQIDPEGQALLDAEAAGLELPETFLAGPVMVTARREGAVVGLAAAWLGAGGVRSRVFVAGAHRRQGIGRHLQAALAVAVDEVGWV